jgi:hypothetical protein
MKLAKGKPVLCMSGTPCVESPSQLFHSFFALGSSYGTFYQWHKRYGIPNVLHFGGRQVKDYSQCKPEVMEGFGRMSVVMTQEDAGIRSEVVDIVHTIDPSEVTVVYIEELRKHGMTLVGQFLTGTEVIAESDMGLRALIHQIETGALHFEEEYIETGCTALTDYLKKNFDPERDGVMAHYRSTQRMLAEAGWDVYSSQAHAEGVDLSRYDRLVIVNSGYSGAKHIQRRQRLTNLAKERHGPVEVHHITVKGGISPEVYAAVSEKKDFNVTAFRRWRSV